MLTYIVRRLLLMIPTLLGVTAVVFFVMALAPGGFGGVVLREGAQTEGQEARRIRLYFARRYGLDQPPIVQYGRWLNQVSPIGFRTSAVVTFSDEQRAAAREVLGQSAAVQGPATLASAMAVTIDLAKYHDADLAETARRVREELEAPLERLVPLEGVEPGEGFAPPGRPDEPAGLRVLHELGVAPVDNAYVTRELAALLPERREAAQRLWLERVGEEASGRVRVLFRRPALKMPDLGTSLRGRRVTDLLAEAVPITLLLNVITIPIIYAIAIVTGVYAARRRGGVFDVGSGTLLLALWSVPVIWAGVLMIGYLANVQYLRWFPTGGLHSLEAASMPFLPRWNDAGFQRGWLLDSMWHLALPVLCLTYGGFAVLAKLTRGAVLENISSDFVRTARAKGVDERTVLFRHVLRNSVLPLITVAAAILPGLLAGAVVVENIFSIPGMGKLGVDAAFMKDREVVMGTTLIGGLIGLGSELIRDIWYAAADPRVSYE